MTKSQTFLKPAPYSSSFVTTVSIYQVDIGQNTFFWDSGFCKLAEVAFKDICIQKMEQNREGIPQ